MNKQKGFTLVELLAVVWGVFCVGVIIGLGYVAVHFISKFW